MQTYIGTKIITAKQHDNAMGQPGYAVRYADGYSSWSPKEPFEESYRTLDAMLFGHAIEMLKLGRKVARAGWNGKGMFLYLVGADSYPAKTAIAKAHFGEDALVPYRAYIAMKTVDNDVVPWLASQTDVLADDWQIVA